MSQRIRAGLDRVRFTLSQSPNGFIGASLAVCLGFVTFGTVELVVSSETSSWQEAMHRLSAFPQAVAVAVALTAVVVGMVVVNELCKQLRYDAYVASPKRMPVVPVAMAIAIALELTPIGSQSPVGLLLPLAFLFMFLVALAFKTYSAKDSGRRRASVGTPEKNAVTLTRLLQKVSGEAGFDPLGEAPEEDTLDRKRYVALLEQLLTSWSGPSLTIAVEGPWGIGKTSLLRHLRRKLETSGYSVVMFSAWDYRDPERVVQAYFDALGGLVTGFRERHQLRELALGLSESRGSLMGFLAKASGLLRHTSIERSRVDVESFLRRKRAFVLVDDLDRLSKDEVDAVIRAVRLVGTLTGIRQVLAYDRDHLARNLAVRTDDQAREFMAKIVNLELSLSAPAEALLSMLGSALEPLRFGAREQELEGIRNIITSLQGARLARALRTPREVKRVAVATALRVFSDRGSVGLRDAFLLSLLQYGAPNVYAYVRDHPELFTETEWAEGSARFIYESEWKQGRDAYMKELREQPAMLFWLDVLEMLVTPGDRNGGQLSSIEALRQRRIIHPELFDRYFHLFASPTRLGMDEIEDLARDLAEKDEGESRRRWFEQVLNRGRDSGRLDDLVDKLELLLCLAKKKDQSGHARRIEDVGVALARYSTGLSDEESFFMWSQRKRAASAVLGWLVEQDAEAATEIAVEIVRNSTHPEFAAQIVYAVKHPDEVEGCHLDVDATRVSEAFVALARQLTEEVTTLDRARLYRSAIVRFGAADEVVRGRLLTELRQSPIGLPRLLELDLRVQTLPEFGRIDPSEFTGAVLSTWISLEQVHAATAETELSTWSSERDRELVRRFRSVVAENGGVRPSDASG